MVAVPSIGRASEVTPRRTAPEADATRDLYERYARQIFAYCLHQLGSKEEAEDAMQSTFLNAFRGFKRGVDPEFESAWLYKIAQNVCLTRQRSSSRRRRVESPGDLDAMQDMLPAREVDSDELLGLPQALEHLPEQQRRALLLREWQGLSYKEIGDELALSQAAVETLLFRARRSLAAGLTEEKPGPAKRVVTKLRAGSDAGSIAALLKTFFSFGGAKVVATVATVAATSVVAATPSVRNAVEHAVAPAKPHHVAPVVLVTAHAATGHASSRAALRSPGLQTMSNARVAARRGHRKAVARGASLGKTSLRTPVRGGLVPPAAGDPGSATAPSAAAPAGPSAPAVTPMAPTAPAPTAAAPTAPAATEPTSVTAPTSSPASTTPTDAPAAASTPAPTTPASSTPASSTPTSSTPTSSTPTSSTSTTTPQKQFTPTQMPATVHQSGGTPAVVPPESTSSTPAGTAPPTSAPTTPAATTPSTPAPSSAPSETGTPTNGTTAAADASATTTSSSTTTNAPGAMHPPPGGTGLIGR